MSKNKNNIVNITPSNYADAITIVLDLKKELEQRISNYATNEIVEDLMSGSFGISKKAISNVLGIQKQLTEARIRSIDILLDEIDRLRESGNDTK